MKKEEPQLDLRKYSRFKRTLPWSLIVKILIAVLVILSLYFSKSYLNESSDNKTKDEGFEIEIID